MLVQFSLLYSLIKASIASDPLNVSKCESVEVMIALKLFTPQLVGKTRQLGRSKILWIMCMYIYIYIFIYYIYLYIIYIYILYIFIYYIYICAHAMLKYTLYWRYMNWNALATGIQVTAGPCKLMNNAI